MNQGGKRLAVVAAVVAAALLAVSAPAEARAGGGAKAHSSIVGGAPADPARWGSTVALLRRNRLECTGSIIAPTRVLTAAHCAVGIDPSELLVLAGRARIGDAATGESLGVSQIAVDPDFGAGPPHDFAVLTLTAPTSSPPIELATAAEEAASTGAGAALGAAGYGQRNPLIFGHPRIGILGEISQRVRDNCARLLGPTFLPDQMICALGDQIRHIPVHRGVCFGDSGGPLVADTATGRRLVGVASEVSGGFFGCGLFGAPNIYSRVSPDLGWIRGAAGLAPPPPQLVSFAGPGFVYAERQQQFPIVCNTACTVTTTMTPIILGRAVKPTISTIQLQAGVVGAPVLPIPKAAVNALHHVPLLANILVQLDASGPGKPPQESRSRLYGFHR